MTKSIGITAFLFLLPILLFSQQFTLIANDPSGDCTCSCSDLKTASFAVNIGQDSVWFKIETFNARPADYGYSIVIDMDNNLSNGDSWSGASIGVCGGLMNYAINHDRMINVWPNLKFIEAFTQQGGSIVNYNVNATIIDPVTIIIGAKLSDIDADSDGIFNTIFATGQDSYRNFDVLPDNGYITTFSTDIATFSKSKVELLIGPNPFSMRTNIRLLGTSVGSFVLSDVLGNKVRDIELKSSQTYIFDRGGLSAGIYFYTLSGKEINPFSGKLILE